MPILYDNPKEVGADRIANAVGAYDLYGGPTVIVDFGTATTFDAVSGKGEYLGGAIVPGIEISLDALFERAAALRRVELAEPRNVIGRSTVESLQSGAVYGFTSQVDGMCERFREELGDVTVVATGGLAAVIAPLSRSIEHHEPWLTLHGLRLIYERNRTSRADRGYRPSGRCCSDRHPPRSEGPNDRGAPHDHRPHQPSRPPGDPRAHPRHRRHRARSWSASRARPASTPMARSSARRISTRPARRSSTSRAAMEAAGVGPNDVARLNIYVVDYSEEALAAIFTAAYEALGEDVAFAREHAGRRRGAVAARPVDRDRRAGDRLTR